MYIYIYMKEINMVSGDIIQLLVPRKIKEALTFQDGRKSTAEGLSCISLTRMSGVTVEMIPTQRLQIRG